MILSLIKKFISDEFGGGGGKGGGGDYSPPPAPDPAATAAAQGAQDRATAKTNAVMLNPNIVSPYGNILYDTNSYNVDPSSNSVTRPTQTIQLSADQQKQLDYKNAVMNSLGGVAQNWANTFQSRDPLVYNTSNIPTNINYSGVSPVSNMSDYQDQANQASKAYYDQAYNLMKPDLDLQQKSLDNRLIQSGNPISSEAYQNQMGSFQRNQDTALKSLADQAVTQGYNIQNQLFNNANTTRANQIEAAQLPYQTQSMLSANQFAAQQQQQNQNINAMAALLNGSQAISNPSLPVGAQYNGTAQTSPNIMGMTQSNYQNQLSAYNNAYNANQANSNAATQGLFGIAGALGQGIAGSNWFGGLFA
jgi:hypothetical protein